MNYYQKCEMIKKWNECIKKDFDITFIENVMDYYDDRGEFTTGQENAIDNIIQKFHIKFENLRKYF